MTFTDDGGNEETLTSASTEAVAARPNRPATGAPTIAGAAQAGETLTASTGGIADADGLTGAVFAYQWIASDGGGDADIAGATGSSYTLGDSDVGRAIKVRVAFTDDRGHAESLTSAPTAAVLPRPLTAAFEAVPAEHDGKRLFSFELVFSDNFGGTFRLQGAARPGAAGERRAYCRTPRAWRRGATTAGRSRCGRARTRP